MAKSHLRVVCQPKKYEQSSHGVQRTPTLDAEHLTPNEVERLMKAAGDNRYGHRDEP